ncbi:DUF4136 domain-containing protein [Alicycliphilus denitrificans]|uniref:DUF4136 domain-containing protein n=1 Tax=Alicycliphilus denitrificans TaxID=179636 RepID=UPI00384F27FE
MASMRHVHALILCAAAALLAGCAGPRLVESDVSSYSSLTALPSPPTYRFERLPSQQAHAAAYAAIEAQAEAALARVGLRRDDTQPRLIALLGAEGGYAAPRNWPYYGPDPFYGRWGWGLGYGGRWGMSASWMMDAPPTLYHRKVSLMLRDAASGQVVYETSAVYEDVWTRDPAIYGVLFDQALTGFPQPPRGQRTVRTEMLPATAQPQPAAAPTR